MRSRREKVFGPGRAVPLDRNAKARITAYARAWSRLHRQDGQNRPDHQSRTGRPTDVAVAVPQRPLALLLPEL